MNESEEEKAPLTEAGRETIKLRATWINGISIAIFAVGALAPMTRSVLDTSLTFANAIGPFIFAFVCLSVAWGLHLKARRVLRALDR